MNRFSSRGVGIGLFVADFGILLFPMVGQTRAKEVAAQAYDVSFMAPQNFVAGTDPASVAVGDFNSDGWPDLAVANFNSHNVSVLLGNGDGTFQPARNFGAGSYPSSVAVADFNGDGALDLAVADSYSYGVSVFLGNGDGSFQPARVFVGYDFRPYSVAVGDFNGDGWPDRATANFASFTASLFLGNG